MKNIETKQTEKLIKELKEINMRLSCEQQQQVQDMYAKEILHSLSVVEQNAIQTFWANQRRPLLYIVILLSMLFGFIFAKILGLLMLMVV